MHTNTKSCNFYLSSIFSYSDILTKTSNFGFERVVDELLLIISVMHLNKLVASHEQCNYDEIESGRDGLVT